MTFSPWNLPKSSVPKPPKSQYFHNPSMTHNMMMLDFLMIIMMFIFALMILCGFFSLAERKILALVQQRIGPGLFIFGLTTPMTDGIKLFIKFILFIIGFDIIYFLLTILMTLFCMYFIWFFIPLGFMIFFDSSFTMMMLIATHIIINVFSIFLVGCFLFCSCFMYLATISVLFFSMLAESSMNILYYSIYLCDYFSYFSIKDISTTQLLMQNFWTLGLLYTIFFSITTMLDCLRMPWEYAESESELVAGIVTEFSGFFFMVYSLLEINHIIFSSLMIATLLFGGTLMTIKTMMMLFIFFLYPRSIACSIKMTTAHTFMLLFLFTINFTFFLWNIIIKMLMLLI